MLGPGLGEVIARMIRQETTEKDQIVLEAFSHTGSSLLKKRLNDFWVKRG